MSRTVNYGTGFAPRDYEPSYPSLWRGCLGAWCPSLGSTGGRLLDWSGRGYHGTLTNMELDADWTPRGLEFDGNNEFVVVATAWKSWTHQYISFWLRYDAWTANWPRVIEKGINSEWTINFNTSINSGKRLCIQLADGATSLTGTFDMDDSVWRHVVVGIKHNGGSSYNLNLWINGKLDASSTVNKSPSSTGDIGIGGINAALCYMDGAIDDIRIFGRVLTSSEISLLALRPRIAYEPEQRSLWLASAGGGGGGSAVLQAMHLQRLMRT